MPSKKQSIGLRSSVVALLVPMALLAGGCTMCPDPFDYSGPVPNGSVTQNDFAARSNGTRPVRSTPFPWPPIVDGSRRQPTPADDTIATVLVAAERPLAAEESVASVVAESEPEPTDATSESFDHAPSVVRIGGDAPGPVVVAPGIVPPRGAWMTEDRRLPPPGIVTPPAQRRAAKPAPEESGLRAAMRSFIGR